jgi:hypothetical protein
MAMGKTHPTQPHLPGGTEWMLPTLSNVGQQAAGNINYGPSNAAGAAGEIGSAAGGMNALGVAGQQGGVNQAFGNALGSLNTGMSTGYLPDLNNLDALLRPGLDRSFSTGSAALRDQNSLTGNLSSSGASQQMTDYRAQLENNLNNNVASIYGQAIPTSMNIRAGSTGLAAGLPGQLQSSLYGPLTAQGLAGQQFPLQALGTATTGVATAPFYAQQGGKSSGLGGMLGSMIKKK